MSNKHYEYTVACVTLICALVVALVTGAAGVTKADELIEETGELLAESVTESEDDPVEPEEEEPTLILVAAAPQAEKPVLSLSVNNETHVHYISGYPGGTFLPGGRVKRAEACKMLFELLAEKPEDRAEFADVLEGDWYYDAVGLLAAGGIVDSDDEYYRPGEDITRGEFTAMVSRLFPEDREYDCFFDDVTNSRYYFDIGKAAYHGWVTGYPDNTFRPDEPLSRAEAVTIINRALERTPDTEYLKGVFFPKFNDVPKNHWAFAQIMEAAVDHTPEIADGTESWTAADIEYVELEPGIYRIDNFDFYYIDPETHGAVTNAYVGSLYFGEDGLYTSGDAEIDGNIKDILASIIKDDMTEEQKLRAAYNYVRDSYSYLRRHYYEIGDTGWELEEARTMLTTKRGNCYCYTGVFYYLSRQLGYDSTAISGVVGHRRSPHGWVEIEFDGTVYIFDTELEMSYRKKGTYIYDFFKMPYSAVPWPYEK